MAGKSIIEPDWQWVVSIYPTFFIHADGIEKYVTMSRKHSGLYAVT